MKTNEGNYVMCIFSGKICYTEREAGLVINGCKKHFYAGAAAGPSRPTETPNQFLAENTTAKTVAFIT